MTEAKWTGPSLREVANTLRTKPTPLSALIPQLQRAADKIDAQAAEIAALRAALKRITETYDAYRRRGVNPAPAEYADLVDAIDAARTTP